MIRIVKSIDQVSEETKMPNRTHDTRLADLHNPPKLRWRDAFRALAMPATRLHEYRNLHREMFYEAVRDFDCKDRK